LGFDDIDSEWLAIPANSVSRLWGTFFTYCPCRKMRPPTGVGKTIDISEVQLIWNHRSLRNRRLLLRNV
jgi:hypothetical protein